jgi:polyisoprenyl-teichoic acid--peptidoglycan teichoic acid transferase
MLTTMSTNLAPRDARQEPSHPRPLIAAALSAIIPGLGQFYAGYRRRAWVYLAITAVFVIPAVTLFVLVFYITGIGLAVDLSRPFFDNPSLLLVLLVLNALLLAFRAISIVDAFLLARSEPGPLGTRTGAAGVAVAAAMAVVLFVTAVPHGWAGQRNLLLYDLLTHDFVTDPDQSTTTTAPPTTTVPGGTTSPTTTAPTTTTTTMPDIFAGTDRVNVLLLGSDAGVGRRGDRTDTMIIVSVDPVTGATGMFSIPRNMIKLPIPPDHPAYARFEDGAFGDPSLLAWSVYEYGRANPDLFEGLNTGGDATKVILGNLVGLQVHYFALVDLVGFVDIIDALGGVDITVTRRIYDPAYPHEDGVTTVELELLPGTYHMTGHEALAFARTRADSSDFDRMGRQRCVLEALARQADPVALLRNFPMLVPAIRASVITDIPIRNIPDFIELLAKVDTSEIVSMRFMPNAPEFEGTPTSYISHRIQGYNVPNVDLIRSRVEIATTHPPAEAIAMLNLQPLDEVCGIVDPPEEDPGP